MSKKKAPSLPNEDPKLKLNLSSRNVTGDKIQISGDFRGAIINIKSTLTNVQQSVNEIHTEQVDTREELAQLIEQLSDILQQVPDSRQEEAEAVAETAKVLVDIAKSEKLNKTMIQITADGFKQATKNVSDISPDVMPIAARIVTAISQLIS